MKKLVSEMSRARPGWSDAKLRSDSRTLVHEFQSLCGMVARVSSRRFRDDPVVENAIGESFAIHCRGLIAFFFSHDRKNKAGRLRDTDVLAAGYFRDGEVWADYCPPFRPVLGDAKSQADKQVAHITVERRELNQPGGTDSVRRMSEIHAALCAAMQAFIENVRDSLFAPGVKAELRALLDVAPADRSSPTSQTTANLQAKTTPVMPVHSMTLKGPQA
ncbi:MAG: hypothetical protein ACYC35_14310 [Pirellulales bacterium]